MKAFLLALLLLAGWTCNILAVSFTEWYVNPDAAHGCTNINAGSTSTGAPAYTTIATGAGGWNSGGTFTPDDGSTPASSVAVGDWVSIYTNSVNTNTPFVGRVTAVAAGVNGAITVSTTAKHGTAPTTVAGSTAAISLRAGGTWQGPWTNSLGGTSVTFPWAFVGANGTNAAGSMVCVNFIGGTNYNTTNSMNPTANGPIRWEGYTNAVHDGGRATFDGSTLAITGYAMMNTSASRNDFVNLVFQNNGSTSTGDGVVTTGNGQLWMGCVVKGMRSCGFNNGGLNMIVESEFSTNNLSNTASKAGVLNGTASTIFLRCFVHDNTGANTSGFQLSQATTFIQCVIARNGLNGITCNTTADPIVLLNCDIYGNLSAGLDMNAAAPAVSQLLYFENSNAITNGTFGFNSSTASTFWKRNGGFFNLGLGSGNRTNSSGGFGLGLTNVYQSGIITYASGVVPWVNPDTGNYNINLAAAYGTGRGQFMETGGALTGTKAYNSVGAAQPAGFTNTTASAFAQ